jgi:hypothetical protein
VLAQVDDPGAELVREDVQRLQVLVSHAERFARCSRFHANLCVRALCSRRR